MNLNTYMYILSCCVVENIWQSVCIYRIDGVNLYSVQLPSLDPYLVFMMHQLIVVPSGVRPVGCYLDVCTVDVLFFNCIYLTQSIVREFNCILPSLKRYVVVLNVACWNLYVVSLHVDFTFVMFVFSLSHGYMVVVCVGEV